MSVIIFTWIFRHNIIRIGYSSHTNHLGYEGRNTTYVRSIRVNYLHLTAQSQTQCHQKNIEYKV